MITIEVGGNLAGVLIAAVIAMSVAWIFTRR